MKNGARKWYVISDNPLRKVKLCEKHNPQPIPKWLQSADLIGQSGFVFPPIQAQSQSRELSRWSIRANTNKKLASNARINDKEGKEKYHNHMGDGACPLSE